MNVRYKGIMCRLGTYRTMGRDVPALSPVNSGDPRLYEAGFTELSCGLWGLLLSEREYEEIMRLAEEKYDKS